MFIAFNRKACHPAVALDDQGNEFKFNQEFEKFTTRQQVEAVVAGDDNALNNKFIEVSELRKVRDFDGKFCNQDKWKDWGYSSP